jgi:hypothetical protein
MCQVQVCLSARTSLEWDKSAYDHYRETLRLG